jgi:hypothetical protein
MEGTPLLYPLATKSAIGKFEVVLSWRICRTGLLARHATDGPGDPSYINSQLKPLAWKDVSHRSPGHQLNKLYRKRQNQALVPGC